MDYSWIDTVIGAGVAYLAYLTGAQRERNRKPKEKQAICGCGHHRSFHKDGTGKCNKDRFEGTCRCQKYHGPIPYDEFIAEET